MAMASPRRSNRDETSFGVDFQGSAVGLNICLVMGHQEDRGVGLGEGGEDQIPD